MKYTNLIHKSATRQVLDVGDGSFLEYDDKDEKTALFAKRVHKLRQPMGFGGAIADAAPAALLAAAIGGVGSLALSGGNPGAAAVGAIGSGLGTALLNGLSNQDERSMSVEEAMDSANKYVKSVYGKGNKRK